MNTEFNRVSHIGTSVIVSYRFCAEDTIRIYDLLIIISQENSRQYVHLLHYQLVYKQEKNIRTRSPYYYKKQKIVV